MRLHITILLTALVNLVGAQNEWKPGYILKTQQDTVWGSLLNKKYSKNAKSINFRTNEGEKETTFVPSEIYGYRFTNGKFYVAKYVDSTHGKLFLEYLINGELDAYFYRDRYGGNHYYIEKDSLELRELKYQDQMIYKDGKTYRRTTIEYKGVLDFYTRDTKGLKKEISKLNTLGHKSLVKIAKKYHELSCSDGSYIEYGKDVKRKILFSIDFGNFLVSSTYRSETTRNNNRYISGSFYFQQMERNENLFFLIGFNQFLDDKKSIGIPFGIEYIDLQPGLGFNGSYIFDLASLFFLHYFGAGFHYKIDNLILQTKIRIAGTIEFEIAGVQPSFGIMYSFR